LIDNIKTNDRCGIYRPLFKNIAQDCNCLGILITVGRYSEYGGIAPATPQSRGYSNLVVRRISSVERQLFLRKSKAVRFWLDQEDISPRATRSTVSSNTAPIARYLRRSHRARTRLSAQIFLIEVWGSGEHGWNSSTVLSRLIFS